MIIDAAHRLDHIQEYYFAGKLREIRRRNTEGADIINLGIGNPDQGPSEGTVKELATQAIDADNHGYQPYKGIPELRNAFAQYYLGCYGVTLDPETEILPLMGSKEGIMHISLAFLNPGDQVLVPNPGYPAYASNARMAGAEPVLYELTEAQGWMPDLERLGDADLDRVKIMWINYPHMPTGAVAEEEDFERLIQFAKAHGILLVNDNPYSLVLNPEPRSILHVPGAKEVALELNSLSKSHNMAGWRIGMVAGRQDYVETVIRVKSNMDSGMFKPMQLAAVHALNQPLSFRESINLEYAARKEKIVELMETLGCEVRPDQVGMFVWARIPATQESAATYADQILDEARVFITPGMIFGSQGAQYLRASLCTPIPRIEEALDRIRTAHISVTTKETTPSI
ncbi:aminotransferase class I/II-fold pyridoxal phosphate-dependent enzyme [Pontibacter sp. G13]|uniref:pyridoxal phosphate-dependent aminotransferase n=1 Tax=Pontibacter sp. G13 TaxID=3074898 RepID=UPI002889FEC3|nr:aminotransferase class I/II-fold pyridoxal phosphate-dependent enzyme [Pontibacter sp. G13]WNJ17545.1 aminotransferase class I/II-fold pyridoxal phosphate-dependent enzyme [Pontibacter sp. G13]